MSNRPIQATLVLSSAILATCARADTPYTAIQSYVDAIASSGDYPGTVQQVGQRKDVSNSEAVITSASGVLSTYRYDADGNLIPFSQLTGSAKAAAQSSPTEISVSAESANAGFDSSYTYNSVNALAGGQVDDFVTFTGSGTATFHYELTGTITSIGHGDNGSLYGPEANILFGIDLQGASISFSPMNAGSVVIATNPAEFSNFPSVLAASSPFSYSWTESVDFFDGEQLILAEYLYAGNENGAASARLKLTGVTFSSDGASVTDGLGGFLYSSAVPEPTAIVMMTVGIALVGSVNPRARGKRH